MFDTHCHLTYFDNPHELIGQAKEANLVGVLSLSTNTDNFEPNLTLKRNYIDFVKIGIGIHPEDASHDKFKSLNRFYQDNNTEIDVVGEIGLDYFHNTSNLSMQKELFEMQIEIAKKYDKPIVVHSRNSKDAGFHSCIKDAIELLDKFDGKAVLHCFTGSLEEAKLVLESGCYVGFTNIITYPKNLELQGIAKFAIENFPDKVLFETDAPFLPPANRRRQICFPDDVKYVYEWFKENTSVEQVKQNVIDFLS